MRHTSLSLISLLLFSSILMAQRAGTGPSTPAPAPSAASSTPQSAAPAASAPISAPAVTSHSSTIVTPVSPTAPATHIAPASAFPPTHSFNSPAGNLEPSRPATHVPGPTSRSLVPEQKISGESRISSAPRIGEKPPEKEVGAEPAPEVRHRVCPEGPCKNLATKPGPPESDLRHHHCLTGNCPCPPGQSPNKNGCVATVLTNPVEYCTPGEYWNGAACGPPPACAPGELWNGVSCVVSDMACAAFDNRAEMLINELLALKAQVRTACSQDPGSQECDDRKLRQRQTLEQYQMLQTEAGPNCAAVLPDPISLQ